VFNRSRQDREHFYLFPRIAIPFFLRRFHAALFVLVPKTVNTPTSVSGFTARPACEEEEMESENTPLFRLVDLRTTAKVLGVSDRTVWTLATSGKLASIRIGRRRLFDLGDIESFVERQKVGGK
jgi:excisionase family DNA binding protein